MTGETQTAAPLHPAFFFFFRMRRQAEESSLTTSHRQFNGSSGSIHIFHCAVVWGNEHMTCVRLPVPHLDFWLGSTDRNSPSVTPAADSPVPGNRLALSASISGDIERLTAVRWSAGERQTARTRQSHDHTSILSSGPAQREQMDRKRASHFLRALPGLLTCHSWLWMVRASTLTDTDLAGTTLNCLRSELYL
ncbi:hypothetical protein EYF80_034264 [Liparis tanakae]|uniref:Uncharacterized protein n=1 Tax=Liparis tanakae TaxID=230148 RepID=A0A4Z2GS33_9TELE|nr:hypothetical protein EYF80_034264 [Liparis tanakae]